MFYMVKQNYLIYITYKSSIIMIIAYLFQTFISFWNICWSELPKTGSFWSLKRTHQNQNMYPKTKQIITVYKLYKISYVKTNIYLIFGYH